MAQVERTEGHGGIYAILIVIVILIIGAVLYFSGVGRTPNEADIDVEIRVPGTPGTDPGGGGQGGSQAAASHIPVRLA